jgi:hypothetical protein
MGRPTGRARNRNGLKSGSVSSSGLPGAPDRDRVTSHDAPSAPESRAAPGTAGVTDAGGRSLTVGSSAATAKQAKWEWTNEERALLNEWAARVSAAQHAHYYLMTRLRRKNLWLGVPVVVLTTAVGTSIFATLQKGDVSTALRVVAGVVSLAAAILASIQGFLKVAERAERNGVAADWFSSVRRDIELIQATPEAHRGPPATVLGGLKKEINKIVQNYPEIGEKVWHRFATQYGAKDPIGG